ncbi:MAG: hypothetical protein IT159_03560 [Bryobacterales bacterium]|nr:hypothetical protein [Bryobacterales bacterium]
MVRWLAPLLLLLPAAQCAWEGTAADLAVQIRTAGLDRDECYRVRDVSFAKEDLRFYLTEGYLVFGKAVDGYRRSALFVGEVEAGDAEVLVFPPTRSERLALSRSAKSPNLNEHFKLAVMVFSDDTCEVLLKQILEAGEPRKSPEMGVLLEQEWNGTVANLTASFEIRLAEDALTEAGPSAGFFFCALRGDQLGNFDILFDPRREEQIVIGRVAERGGVAYFDTWTSFEARSFRNQSRRAPGAGFRLSNYRVAARLEPDLTLKVTTRVTLTPSESGRRVFEFSLSSRMRVAAAYLAGAPAEYLQRESLRESLLRDGDSTILLRASSPLERGRSYEVEFQTEGIVVQSSGNNVYFVGARDNWYPNLPLEFATYEVRFYYPADLNLVVPGDLVDEGVEGDFRFIHARIQTPVRFLGFNLGDYETFSMSRGPYRVEVHGNKQVEPALRAPPRPGATVPMLRRLYDPATRRTVIVTVPVEIVPPVLTPPSQLKELASEIASALEFLAGRFGPPPLRSLTVSPIPGTFGQGFPGLLYLSTVSYLRPEDRPAAASGPYFETFYSDILAAHEVAHQWWGNAVSSQGPQNTWLMEALANYSALLYLEKRRGVKALDSVLAEYRKRLLSVTSEGRTIESTGPIVWGGRLLSSQAPQAWQTIVYEKGSWIIHMLRRRMGDDRFFAMLAELVKRYNRSALSAEQFRLAASKYMPPGSPDPGLETFFQNYVYSTGLPALRLQSSIRGGASGWTVTGKVTQSGVDEDFSAWVPVEIQFKTGRPAVHWVRTDSDPVEFSASFKQQPVKVVLDPSDTILAVKR